MPPSDAEARYTFDLVTELGRRPSLVTSEGTIYPLLSRVRKDGLVATEWRDFRDAVDDTLRKDLP